MTTSPSRPPEYSYIELFGHTNLGACEVREIDRFGSKMCEARPLDKEGNPGKVHRFPGSAIYHEQELSEAEAKRLARGPVLALAVPTPPCPTCGYGVCDCSEAERNGRPLADTYQALTPPNDGTPLCDPEAGEDDIPF